MGIQLRSDVFFSDPETRIREYCAIEVYEGYDDRHTVDNVITQNDIDSANNLYAMIDRYDKHESRRILDQSPRISPLLSVIPLKAIYDYSDDEWSRTKPKIEALLTKITSIYGVGVAKATKILHLKRPELFPVLDNYVIQFLSGKIPSSSNRDTSLTIKCLDNTREIIKTQLIEFTDLQRKISDLPINLTIVRLFDILCWSTHKWDILRITTAPRGRASKSLLNIQKNKQTPLKSSKIKPRQILRKKDTHNSSDIVIDFFNELSSRARYGIKGEKPIALLAALKYMMNTKQIGIKFLDLLDYPYYEKVRVNFIELAERYGSLESPSSSWSVTTGVNRELQNAIIDNGRVNEAIADLSPTEIEKLYKLLCTRYVSR